jgi:hypothetical protein
MLRLEAKVIEKLGSIFTGAITAISPQFSTIKNLFLVTNDLC